MEFDNCWGGAIFALTQFVINCISALIFSYAAIVLLTGWLESIWRRGTRLKYAVDNGDGSKVSLTVCVPTYLPGEKDVIMDTLEYIGTELRYGVPFTIIVPYNTDKEHEDAKTLEVEAKLKKLDGWVFENKNEIRVIKCDSAANGKAENMNRALEVAQGSHFVIYDADQHPDPKSLLVLGACMHIENRLGGAHCVSGSRYPRLTWFNPASYYLVLESVAHYYGWLPGCFTFTRLAYFTGSNAMWDTEALREGLRGFRTDLQGEDIDVSFRAHLQGYKIRYCPESRVSERAPRGLVAYFRQRLRRQIAWGEAWRENKSSLQREEIGFGLKIGLISMHVFSWVSRFCIACLISFLPVTIAFAVLEIGGRFTETQYFCRFEHTDIVDIVSLVAIGFIVLVFFFYFLVFDRLRRLFHLLIGFLLWPMFGWVALWKIFYAAHLLSSGQEGPRKPTLWGRRNSDSSDDSDGFDSDDSDSDDERGCCGRKRRKKQSIIIPPIKQGGLGGGGNIIPSPRAVAKKEKRGWFGNKSKKPQDEEEKPKKAGWFGRKKPEKHKARPEKSKPEKSKPEKSKPEKSKPEEPKATPEKKATEEKTGWFGRKKPEEKPDEKKEEKLGWFGRKQPTPDTKPIESEESEEEESEEEEEVRPMSGMLGQFMREAAEEEEKEEKKNKEKEKKKTKPPSSARKVEEMESDFEEEEEEEEEAGIGGMLGNFLKEAIAPPGQAKPDIVGMGGIPALGGFGNMLKEAAAPSGENEGIGGLLGNALKEAIAPPSPSKAKTKTKEAKKGGKKKKSHTVDDGMNPLE